MYCSRDPVTPPEQFVANCRSLAYPHAPFSKYAPPFHNMPLLPRVILGHAPSDVPAAPYELFFNVITHVGASRARDAFRRFIFTQSCSTANGSLEVCTKSAIGYRFFVGSGHFSAEVRAKLSQEVLKYGDVVVLNATDSYTNLVNKVTAAFRWTSQHIDSESVAKVDDDVYVYIQHILDRLRVLRTRYTMGSALHRPRKLYVGNLVTYGIPIVRRGHKWSLPSSQYSGDVLPRYVNGPCYIVSQDVGEYLGRYRAVTADHVFHLEDVFAGLALSDINVFAQSLVPGFINTLHAHSHKLHDCWQRTCVVHALRNQSASFPLLNSIVPKRACMAADVSGIVTKLLDVEEEGLEEQRVLDATLDFLIKRDWQRSQLASLTLTEAGAEASFTLASFAFVALLFEVQYEVTRQLNLVRKMPAIPQMLETNTMVQTRPVAFVARVLVAICVIVFVVLPVMGVYVTIFPFAKHGKLVDAEFGTEPQPVSILQVVIALLALVLASFRVTQSISKTCVFVCAVTSAVRICMWLPASTRICVLSLALALVHARRVTLVQVRLRYKK